MPDPKPCPFCAIPDDRVVHHDRLAFAILDAHPVSPGHTLLIPARHIGSFFDATIEERMSLLALMDEVKRRLDEEFRPASYNIGINDGPAAGQTVPHLHVHLIPRYPGDRADARGGVRWVLPEKAAYWTPEP